MNTPTADNNDRDSARKTRLWSGSILSPSIEQGEPDGDPARTRLGFGSSTVLIDQALRRIDRTDSPLPEKPAPAPPTTEPDPPEACAEAAEPEALDPCADEADRMSLPRLRRNTWLIFAAGAGGLVLVGLLAFVLMRQDVAPASESRPTALLPVAAPLETAVRDQAAVGDSQPDEKNKQMDQLQHQLAELTRQVTVLASRAKRPRKRSRVSTGARKRSQLRSSTATTAKKGARGEKRARVRVRYDHKLNVVEVWLPEGHADVKVRREPAPPSGPTSVAPTRPQPLVP